MSIMTGANWADPKKSDARQSSHRSFESFTPNHEEAAHRISERNL
jgi:hypothetical protein